MFSRSSSFTATSSLKGLQMARYTWEQAGQDRRAGQGEIRHVRAQVWGWGAGKPVARRSAGGEVVWYADEPAQAHVCAPATALVQECVA